jgi:membrane associated rhomboid family serine protease
VIGGGPARARRYLAARSSRTCEPPGRCYASGVGKLRITYNAPVVLTFTIAAVAVFLLCQLAPSLQLWFSAWPHLIDARSYVGLATHILGHASWEHLIGNFMLILLIGPILEERHGSRSLFLMIVLTAVVTGLANLALSQHLLVGASGVAFMMILLASMANVRGGEIPLTFLAVALIYMGGEIVHSFNNDQVSHMAHLVGGAVGGVFGFLAARTKPAKALGAKPNKKVDVAKIKI